MSPLEVVSTVVPYFAFCRDEARNKDIPCPLAPYFKCWFLPKLIIVKAKDKLYLTPCYTC